MIYEGQNPDESQVGHQVTTTPEQGDKHTEANLMAEKAVANILKVAQERRLKEKEAAERKQQMSETVKAVLDSVTKEVGEKELLTLDKNEILKFVCDAIPNLAGPYFTDHLSYSKDNVMNVMLGTRRVTLRLLQRPYDGESHNEFFLQYE